MLDLRISLSEESPLPAGCVGWGVKGDGDVGEDSERGALFVNGG